MNPEQLMIFLLVRGLFFKALAANTLAFLAVAVELPPRLNSRNTLLFAGIGTILYFYQVNANENVQFWALIAECYILTCWRSHPVFGLML